MNPEQLVELTADIVSAHVANNNVAVGDVANLVQRVHEALASLGEKEPEAKQEKTPAVSIRASIKPDYLVCMECGRKQKTLRRHLTSAHNMTPEQYRNDYGLPRDYPMTAPNYSEQRRSMAKEIGLGRKKGSGKSGLPASKPKPAEKKTRGQGRGSRKGPAGQG